MSGQRLRDKKVNSHMEVSLRRVNYRYFCHKCQSAFNNLSNPEHLEEVRCSQCQGDFVELIGKRDNLPSDLPPSQPQPQPEPQPQPQHQPTAAQPQAAPGTESQRRTTGTRTVPLAFTQVEFDPVTGTLYERTIVASMPVIAGQPQEEAKEEASQEAREPQGSLPFFMMGFPQFHLRTTNPLAFMRLFGMGTQEPEGPPPASKEALNKLPVYKLEEQHCKKNPANGELETPSCAVCYNNISIGQEATQLPCGHIYHPTCIRPWLEQHCTCPICRKPMPAENTHSHPMSAHSLFH